MDMLRLAGEIIEGRRLRRGDDLAALATCDLAELEQGAGLIQRHFRRDHIDLCSIINGRSGRCPEDCKYCAQAGRHRTGAKTYGFLPEEEIVAAARRSQEAGLNRFSIVTSGRALAGEEFERALAVFRRLSREFALGLCASMGLLTAEQFRRLRESGVARYHHNLETSRRYFPMICTTHGYDDKVRTIRLAQAAGLEVCSGGIIGMGETWDDRLDIALSLSELGIRSIPVNVLMPIRGTPLEGLERISGDDAMRAIAMFRYVNPEADVRLAAGRKVLPGNGADAFRMGASATISGDMLTTSGTTIAGDLEILRRLGLTNKAV